LEEEGLVGEEEAVVEVDLGEMFSYIQVRLVVYIHADETSFRRI
jgi:hypothetical protein